LAPPTRTATAREPGSELTPLILRPRFLPVAALIGASSRAGFQHTPDTRGGAGLVRRAVSLQSAPMSPSTATDSPARAPAFSHYAPGFRRRRFRNWFFVGLLYAGYYLCRYNLSTVTPELAREFNLNNAQTGWMSTARDLGYMVGQVINGLFSDALGGKQSMAIGAGGTVLLNLAFGWFSSWDVAFILFGFVLIRALDGYAQAFGAPGMVKLNTAWFRRNERGTFAGIFGAMIQLGQVGANQLSRMLVAGGPVLLFGFSLFVLPKLGWRSMFIVPPIMLAVLLLLMWVNVRNYPEEAGYRIPHDDEAGSSHAPTPERLPLRRVFVAIASNPLIWLNAGAYMCTGFVRRAYDYWWAKYLDNEWNITKASPEFGWLGFLLPAAAVLGSFGAGFVSDKLFRSRRSPVAAALYGVESAVIFGGMLLVAHPQFGSPFLACTFLTLISLTCNSSHSIIGTAAVMDIGGRQMAGFALGVVNSFQYLGAMLAGKALGELIDTFGWSALFWSMLPFSLLGMSLMLGVWLVTRGRDVRGA